MRVSTPDCSGTATSDMADLHGCDGSRGRRLVVSRRQKRESIGVIEVALPASKQKQNDRAGDEHEAHKNLQDQDFHRLLLSESENAVSMTVLMLLTGMKMAARTGDITPANTSDTATRL